ncbi:MAG: DUF308 domain-containing protein [Pseudomonadota bacterium]
MSETIRVLEGKVTHLGKSSADQRGFTTWQTIRVSIAHGVHVSIPENKTDALMSTYVADALGRRARIFYAHHYLGNIQKATILAMQLDDGRAYDWGPGLDHERRKGERTLLQQRAWQGLAIVLGVACLTFPWLALLAIALFWGAWQQQRRIELGERMLADLPSSGAFERYYAGRRPPGLLTE